MKHNIYKLLAIIFVIMFFNSLCFGQSKQVPTISGSWMTEGLTGPNEGNVLIEFFSDKTLRYKMQIAQGMWVNFGTGIWTFLDDGRLKVDMNGRLSGMYLGSLRGNMLELEGPWGPGNRGIFKKIK